MEKIWLKQYPTHIPATIETLPYQTINDFFISICGIYADKPALNHLGHAITYAQLYKECCKVAEYFQKELQLQKGDRLAIMMPNCPQYYIALFGAFLAGLIVVNVNPLYTSRELVHQVNDAGVRAIVVLANMAHVVATALPHTTIQHVVVTELGDCLPAIKRYVVNFVVKHIKKLVPHYELPEAHALITILKKSDVQSLQPVQLSAQDIAFLQYTGGTTGIPKGAELTHQNILSNTEQAYAWLQHTLRDGEETIVAALPLYHIFALTITAFIFLKIGGQALLITNPRDIPLFIRTIKQHKFSVMIGVNTLFNALMNNSEFADVDFSHLKLTISGGMALQHVVFDRWEKLTGTCILEGYGLTETSPIVTVNLMGNRTFTGSIGLPLPNTDICVIDEKGQSLGVGEMGELCVKGPQVMKGYWNNPRETADVMHEGSWLKTGDIVKVDERGYVYLVDRLKDMILVSGFCVYPNEIEGILAEHPQVAEVAVIGVPDEHSGEAVKAFIVKRSDALDVAEIDRYSHENLTGYKRPKYIEFLPALPKSNVGKILRKDLRMRREE